MPILSIEARDSEVNSDRAIYLFTLLNIFDKFSHALPLAMFVLIIICDHACLNLQMRIISLFAGSFLLTFVVFCGRQYFVQLESAQANLTHLRAQHTM